ncbi:MAG: hypothetical protein CME64_01355 [Halobacteriovoraceae bacterium]|nr:hypothetical protein [Halobacteriovoraceae bacterium]|tara:strand:+ start:6880 stop:7356 length:477 start_codon:yes stop_codon:yes gene_type:complete
MKKKLLLGKEEVVVDILSSDNNAIEFMFNGKRYSFKRDQESLFFKGKKYSFSSSYIPSAETKQVFVEELEDEVKFIEKAQKATGSLGGAGSLQSPMPGKIFKVLKNEGDAVEAGEAILVLEAMKMEHTIKAQQDGVVKKIHFAEGAQVQGGVELCEIE